MSVIFREQGSEGLVQYLRSAPRQVRGHLLDTMTAGAARLSGMIKDNLSGALLSVKTGRLRSSVYARVYATDKKVTLSFGTRGTLPYAAIQEFGGVTRPHEILPSKARVLAWATDGKQRFAERVQHPGSRIRGVAYIRSAAAEMLPQLEEDIREATERALLMEFYSS